jgi:hypothetical protein
VGWESELQRASVGHQGAVRPDDALDLVKRIELVLLEVVRRSGDLSDRKPARRAQPMRHDMGTGQLAQSPQCCGLLGIESRELFGVEYLPNIRRQLRESSSIVTRLDGVAGGVTAANRDRRDRGPASGDPRRTSVTNRSAAHPMTSTPPHDPLQPEPASAPFLVIELRGDGASWQAQLNAAADSGYQLVALAEQRAVLQLAQTRAR